MFYFSQKILTFFYPLNKIHVVCTLQKHVSEALLMCIPDKVLFGYQKVIIFLLENVWWLFIRSASESCISFYRGVRKMFS